LTRYDYTPRWGALGEVIDRWAFRPAFGWATAWSFDRLRLWLEEGIPPERSRDLALANTIARAGLAAVWIYQGIVPKLWQADASETEIWSRLGLPMPLAKIVVRAIGAAEVALGVAVSRPRNNRWPLLATLASMPAGLLGVGTIDPTRLGRAFNPVSLNWAVSALAAIALVTRKGVPSGAKPLRTAPDPQPEVTFKP
jgi:hypothetical protein